MTNKDIRRQAAFTLSLFARQAFYKDFSKRWFEINNAISGIHNSMANLSEETYAAYEQALDTLEVENPGLDWERNWEQAI